MNETKKYLYQDKLGSTALRNIRISEKTLTLTDLPLPPPGKQGWPWTKAVKSTVRRNFNVLEWPKVSIITPSYNQAQFLEATIRSVLLQNYYNLEYIIIDGGSTDDSVKIIKKYEKFLSFWVSERDQGQASAINKGIRQSSGEILGWLNSDDVYAQGALFHVAKAFSYNPESIVVHGNRILINENGEVTGWSQLPSFNPETSSYNVCSETAFWKRAAMETVGPLNDNLEFAIDLEFFGRLYKHGKFVKLNQFLGYFRCHPASKSSTIAHIGCEEAEREWNKLFGPTDQIISINYKPSVIQKLFTLIKHPQEIGSPYLFYRLFRER
ncbi:glycosyltransferase [Trichocoleus desertorum AS-A10]|uniref:glycosyltransferase family 2 protein n=1 Tax=Trichocoleus desertorum TaxID=1481672 RepID=UPI003297DAC5